MQDPDLRALVDRRAIEDVILQYCRGIDRMDRERVRACYHPDATDDHGSFKGDVEAFLAWVFRLLGRYTNTMHFVGNILVELAGDIAAAETYGIAFHRSKDPAPHLNLMTGFRYLDRFERRDGEWRIAARTAVTEWARVDDTRGRFDVPATLPSGERGAGDALYALLADVGIGSSS